MKITMKILDHNESTIEVSYVFRGKEEIVIVPTPTGELQNRKGLREYLGQHIPVEKLKKRSKIYPNHDLLEQHEDVDLTVRLLREERSAIKPSKAKLVQKDDD